MTKAADFILDHANATLVIFWVGAMIAALVSTKPVARFFGGLLLVVATCLVHVSTRSAYDWTVSALERPSAPGLLLLAALIASAVSSRSLVKLSEFRFGTLVLIVAGLVLYPGAVGYVNLDTYVPGYSGYVLPSALGLLLAFMLYRGYALSALSLNVGIAAFLLGAGRSLNLWDYVVDPIACMVALLCWIGIALSMLRERFAAKPA